MTRSTNNRLFKSIVVFFLIFTVSLNFHIISIGALSPKNTDNLVFNSHDNIQQIVGERLCLPYSSGYIMDYIKGDNGKVLFHIMDTHCNYAAQHSIMNLLEYFSDHLSVEFAFLEGGSGEYDLSLFYGIKEPLIRSEVSDYFVRAGRISGPEFFAINNPGRMELYGIEDEALYEKNLESFKKVIGFEKTKELINSILSAELDNLKKKYFNEHLYDLSKRIALIGSKSGKLFDDIIFLVETADKYGYYLGSFENLSLMRKNITLERTLNVAKTARQRDLLMRYLEDSLSELSVKRILRKAEQVQTGEISKNEYFLRMLRLARFRDVEMSLYGEFEKYCIYLNDYEKVDKTELQSEMCKARDGLLEKLLTTDKQKQLFRLEAKRQRLKKLFDLSFRKSEFEAYSANADNIRFEEFVNFFNDNHEKTEFSSCKDIDPEVFTTLKGAAEKFYEESSRRDKVFAETIEKTMNERKLDRAVMVTGGYHAEALKRILKEKGFTYISIMPKFTKDASYNPYFEVMNGTRIPIESMVFSSISNLAVPSMLSEMGIAGTKEKNLFSLSVEVLEALTREVVERKRDKTVTASGGVILSIPGIGNIRLTTKRPYGRELLGQKYSNLGDLSIAGESVSVYAARENIKEKKGYPEKNIIQDAVFIKVSFDGDKLTYSGHNTIIDLFLNDAHDENYPGLEVYSPGEYFKKNSKVREKVKALLAARLGKTNCGMLMNMIEPEKKNILSKNWLKIITGKGGTPVPWEVGSISTEYGIHIPLTESPDGSVNVEHFVDLLLDLIKKAAGRINPDKVLNRESAGQIINMVKKRIENVQFATSVLSSENALIELTTEFVEICKRRAKIIGVSDLHVRRLVFPDGSIHDVSLKMVYPESESCDDGIEDTFYYDNYEYGKDGIEDSIFFESLEDGEAYPEPDDADDLPSKLFLVVDTREYIIAESSHGIEGVNKSLAFYSLVDEVKAEMPRSREEAIEMFNEKVIFTVAEVEQWLNSPFIESVIMERGADKVSDNQLFLSFTYRMKNKINEGGPCRKFVISETRKLLKNLYSNRIEKRGEFFSYISQGENPGIIKFDETRQCIEVSIKSALSREKSLSVKDLENTGIFLCQAINKKLPESYGLVIGAIPTLYDGTPLEKAIFDAPLGSVKGASKGFISRKRIGNINLVSCMGVSEALKVLTDEKYLPSGNERCPKTRVDISISMSVLNEINNHLIENIETADKLKETLRAEDITLLRRLKNKIGNLTLKEYLRENTMLTIINDSKDNVVYPLSYGNCTILALSGLNLGYVIERVQSGDAAPDEANEFYKEAVQLRTRAFSLITGNPSYKYEIFNELWKKIKDAPGKILAMTFELYLPEVKIIDFEQIRENFLMETEVITSL